MTERTTSDEPRDASPALVQLLRAFNEVWDGEARQELARFAARLVGSKADESVELRRLHVCLDWSVRKILPRSLAAWGLRAEAEEVAALPALATSVLGDVDVMEAVEVIARVRRGWNRVIRGSWAVTMGSCADALVANEWVVADSDSVVAARAVASAYDAASPTRLDHHFAYYSAAIEHATPCALLAAEAVRVLHAVPAFVLRINPDEAGDDFPTAAHWDAAERARPLLGEADAATRAETFEILERLFARR